MKTSNMLAS